MKGFILVLSAPGGTGKTTIMNALKKSKDFVSALSATTRPPRHDEEDGKDYLFVSPQKFSEMKTSGELLEDIEFNGYCYGVIKSYVLDALEHSKNIILPIEARGLKRIKEVMPEEDVIGIFLLPPSMEELERRMINRGSDRTLTLKRMSLAKYEISTASGYDYIVVNDNLKECVKNIRDIVNTEKFRPSRMKKVAQSLLG